MITFNYVFFSCQELEYYFAMFGCYVLEAHSFLMGGRKGADLEGRGGRDEMEEHRDRKV